MQICRRDDPQEGRSQGARNQTDFAVTDQPGNTFQQHRGEGLEIPEEAEKRCEPCSSSSRREGRLRASEKCIVRILGRGKRRNKDAYSYQDERPRQGEPRRARALRRL